MSGPFNQWQPVETVVETVNPFRTVFMGFRSPGDERISICPMFVEVY